MLLKEETFQEAPCEEGIKDFLLSKDVGLKQLQVPAECIHVCFRLPVDKELVVWSILEMFRHPEQAVVPAKGFRDKCCYMYIFFRKLDVTILRRLYVRMGRSPEEAEGTKRDELLLRIMTHLSQASL